MSCDWYKADKTLKNKPPKKIVSNDFIDGRWITLANGRHIFIANKKV